MSIVLDASAAVAWIYEEIAKSDMDRLFRELNQSGAVVPQLWYLEVANVLLLNYRKGRHGFDFVDRRLADFAAFEIKADETHRRAWNATIRLAAGYGLTSYDAAYLELAVRLGAPLATLDKALIRAAQAEHIPLFWDDPAVTN